MSRYLETSGVRPVWTICGSAVSRTRTIVKRSCNELLPPYCTLRSASPLRKGGGHAWDNWNYFEQQ